MVNKLVDALAPAGEGMVSVRIAGEGKMLLSIKGSGADPAVVNVRSGEKETCTWDAFIADMESLCGENDAKESWKILYGEEFPEEKKEVAPVQPEREAKQAPKKPGRVTVSKPQTPEKTKEDNSLTKVNDNVQAQETTAQKEEEQSRDENMEIAPVQPENDTENPQGGAAVMGSDTDESDAGSRIPEETDDPDRVPPYIDGNDPESADAAHGAGSGNTAAVMGSAAGTATEPPAAVLMQDVDGQISIGDMPQCMPDNTAVEQKQDAVGGYLIALKDNLDKVYILTERGEYQNAEKWLEAVRGTIHKIQELDVTDNPAAAVIDEAPEE